MRRMTAIGKLNDFGICNPPRNIMNLLKRTIFIVKSLWRKHRTTDFLDFRFNRPFAERCMQEVGKFANGIAPPPIGINRQAVDFEYIRFN